MKIHHGEHLELNSTRVCMDVDLLALEVFHSSRQLGEAHFELRRLVVGERIGLTVDLPGSEERNLGFRSGEFVALLL